MKVSDIENKINSQINQIRQEWTQIWTTSLPEAESEKYFYESNF